MIFSCDNFLWFIGWLIPFHLWRYSPFWALVSFIRRLHSSVSSARLLHPHIPRIADVSLRKTPFHLVFDFPTDRVLGNFPLRNGWLILNTFPALYQLYRLHVTIVRRTERNGPVLGNACISVWHEQWSTPINSKLMAINLILQGLCIIL